MASFEALAYIVYMREGYSFSLVCTFSLIINNFEVKVDVQKGALRSTKQIHGRCASVIEFTFSFIVVIW
jgi:hypothetical protein